LLEVWRGGGGGEHFFLGAKDFFTGRGGGFQKSSLLEVWRGGGGGEEFFSGDQGFFYREGERSFLGPRKEKGTKIETKNKGRKK
jgi:hypothetical protein